MDWHSFIESVINYLFKPFQSQEAFATALLGGWRELTELNGKIAWPYLVSGAIIAACIFFTGKRKRIIHQTSFWRFICPPEIYAHPSALLDYKYAAIDLSVRLWLYMPLLAGISSLTYKVTAWGMEMSPPMSHSSSVLTFLLAVLVMDFGFFISHYLLHKIPILWQFHQVHHSAEVLTPITLYRAHPIEILVNGVIAAFLSGCIATLFLPLNEADLNFLTFFGVNIVTFAFFSFGSTLRHSHIWLSYGKYASYLLISPAQHQIHHSVALQHRGRNYGYMFAFWDFLFGTLYVPRTREHLRFGLGTIGSNEFLTVSHLYLVPFKKALKTFFHARAAYSRRVP